ncbi:MAG: SET domain-containing protein [Steroidobacteraceae bacterium]
MKPAVLTTSPATAPDRGSCLHPSGIAGVGVVRADGEYRLVATRQIPAGQPLFRIEGELSSRPSRYSVQVGYQLHIDLHGDHTTEEILDRYFWRFMNHSCEPSVLVRERDVAAARDINPWEAVTFNYNTTEWEMSEPFSCRCGSRHCLGKVQGFKFLTAAQRTELSPVAPYFSRLLSEASPLTAARAPA